MALKLTPDGKPLLELGGRGQPSDTGCTEDSGEVLRAAGPFNRPTRIVPSPSGDLYVSDGYRNSRVHRFSAEGTLINSWGTPGKTGPTEFQVSHSLWVDRKGLVYVCDRDNNRMQIFSSDGEVISQWTDLHHPTDIYVGADETIYICEKHEVQGYWISVRDTKVETLWSAGTLPDSTRSGSTPVETSTERSRRIRLLPSGRGRASDISALRHPVGVGFVSTI